MFRRPVVISLALAAAMLVAVSAQAQQGGGRGGRGPGMGGMMPLTMLAQAEPVQKELKLTDDQKTKLKALADEMRDASREERAALQKKVSDILKPDQLDRVKQIQVQAAGAAALANPDVAKTLGLSDEQTTKLKALQDEARTSMRDAMQNVPREERRTKMAELRKENMDKALKVLTADQQAKFEKLQGPKFDVSALRPRGGGGRGRGGAPANN
jgi:Spy/CpxP family protein refolding chaperone